MQVFYNLYIKEESDKERVENLSKEVFWRILPEVHNATLLVKFIGYNPILIANQTITHHYKEGGEGITLHALWK